MTDSITVATPWNLHSTMFLLIHDHSCRYCKWSVFTFHNVSINSDDLADSYCIAMWFTFHNVSINSI